MVSGKIPLPVVSSKIFPDNISVFEIGETGVKIFERELKSCLTGLTSLPYMFCLNFNCKLH